MKQCIKLLKPFEKIPKIINSGMSCISEMISHVVTLLKNLEKENTVDKTRNFLRMRQIEQKNFNFDNGKCLVATFLDLRFKTSFLRPIETARTRSKILITALEICSDESSSIDDDSSLLRKKKKYQ